MNAHRSLWICTCVCGGGAGLVLVAAGQPWVEVSAGARVGLTSAQLVPAAVALGVVGLAAPVALLATAGFARRIVAALIAACGATLVTAIALGMRSGVVEEAARGMSPLLREAGHLSVEYRPWPILVAIGGLMMMAAGVYGVVRGGPWPRMSARYDRAGASAQTPAGLWDAIDRGADPTINDDKER